MAAVVERGPRWRRRDKKLCKPEEVDDDCGSLTWLLSFRLDALVATPADEDAPPPQPAPAPAPPLRAEREEPEERRSTHARKPPYTYPELIECALRERGQLTVSAIYQWISERFPYYRASDERWKNSVRHNLSINPHFRKGGRARRGAGHLWALAENALDLLPVRAACPSLVLNAVPRTAQVIVLDEAAIAAASITPGTEFICHADGLGDDGQTHLSPQYAFALPEYSISTYILGDASGDEPALAAAAAAAAFLNPVSAEQVVLESGLLSAE